MAIRLHRVLLLAGLVVAAVGVLDAVTAAEADLVALFVAVIAIDLALLAGTVTSRRAVPVRADLFRWLQHRADLTGDSPARIAGRALATYRLQLGERSAVTEAEGAPGSRPTRS